MKHALMISAVLFAVTLGACSANPVRNPDPSRTDAAAIDISELRPEKASFTLRIKIFERRGGTWVPALDAVPEMEKAAIEYLEKDGYTYTPYPDQSRYNIEFHLTCYDPFGDDRQHDPAPFADDGFWGPYAYHERAYVVTITPGAPQPAGPKYCAGKMLILVRDREAGNGQKVYAATQDLEPCAYSGGCAFSACRDRQANAVIKYLNIVFFE